MKRNIIFLGLAILLSACAGNKANNPEPINPPNNGGDGNGTPKPTYKRVIIDTYGGNGAFDDNGGLKSISLGDANSSTEFKTTLGNSANSKTTLENAQGAVIDNALGTWRAKWPNYSNTDTLRQPYIRVIITDASKNIVEYRAYIVGATASLARYENKLPSTMDLAAFAKGFATTNTQRILSVYGAK